MNATTRTEGEALTLDLEPAEPLLPAVPRGGSLAMPTAPVFTRSASFIIELLARGVRAEQRSRPRVADRRKATRRAKLVRGPVLGWVAQRHARERPSSSRAREDRAAEPGHKQS